LGLSPRGLAVRAPLSAGDWIDAQGIAAAHDTEASVTATCDDFTKPLAAAGTGVAASRRCGLVRLAACAAFASFTEGLAARVRSAARSGLTCVIGSSPAVALFRRSVDILHTTWEKQQEETGKCSGPRHPAPGCFLHHRRWPYQNQPIDEECEFLRLTG
jgi:hypothetical protein